MDIPVMDILITDAVIPIRTRTTGRTITDTTVDRRFIGPVVIACIIRADIIGITGIGTKPAESQILWPAGYDSRRLYFFGEPDAAGLDVDPAAGEGS